MNATLLRLLTLLLTSGTVIVATAHAGDPPSKRLPPDDEAKKVAELEMRTGDAEAAGRFADAAVAAEEVLALRHRLQGQTHWQSVSARWRAETLRRLADGPEETRKAVIDALRIETEADGHAKKDEHVETELLFRQALALRRKAVGEKHPDVARDLDWLAGSLHAQGRHTEATPLLQRAFDIHQTVFTDRHPATAGSYTNLAHNASAMGDNAGARKLHEKALAVHRDLFTEQHPKTATSYSNLAMICHAAGDYAKAIEYHQKALQLRIALWTEDHPDTATSHHNLAASLDANKDTAGALLHYRTALEVRRRILRPDHPDVAVTLGAIAGHLHAHGDLVEARKHWAEAADVFDRWRERSAGTRPESSYLAAEGSCDTALAAQAARAGEPREAWRRLERALGRGLHEDLVARLSLQLIAPEQLRYRNVQDQLSSLDASLTRLEEELFTPARREQMQRVEKERTAVQREWSELQAEVRRRSPIPDQGFDLEQVQKHLPPEAALVAWVDLKSSVPGGREEHWICFLRMKGDPVWLPLPGNGPDGSWGARDEALPDRIRQRMSQPPTGAAENWHGPAMRLSTQRLSHLMLQAVPGGELPALQHLIILPSPGLAGIPVEDLILLWPNTAASGTASYVPSATMLTWLAELPPRQAQAGGRLLVLGDPVFRKPDPSEGRESDALVRGRTWLPLPGTRQEGIAITHLFPESVALFGPDASEPKLHELARTDRLQDFDFIHLATHGQADPAMPMRSALILSEEGLPEAVEQLLAGKPAFTGRLTAEHILRMWSLDADLVTLSACESGVRRQAGGEGYVGFAQALFVAGARTVVLSRWKVDERATLLFMTRFYQNLRGQRPGLKRPLSKAVALAEAKRWLRTLRLDEANRVLNELRGENIAAAPPDSEVRPYAHPHYWASFLLAGDPGDVSQPIPPITGAAVPSPETEPAAEWPTWPLLVVVVLLFGGVAWYFRRRPVGQVAVKRYKRSV